VHYCTLGGGGLRDAHKEGDRENDHVLGKCVAWLIKENVMKGDVVGVCRGLPHARF